MKQYKGKPILRNASAFEHVIDLQRGRLNQITWDDSLKEQREQITKITLSNTEQHSYLNSLPVYL